MLMPEGPGLRWIASFNHVISLFLRTWLGACSRATAGFTKKTVWKVCIFHCTNNGQNPSSQEQCISTVLHIVRALKRKRNGAGLLQQWDRNAIEVSFPAQGWLRAVLRLVGAAASSWNHPPKVKKAENGSAFNQFNRLSWGQSEWGAEIPSSPPGEEWERSLGVSQPLDMQRPSLIAQWCSTGPWPPAAQHMPSWASNPLK